MLKHYPLLIKIFKIVIIPILFMTLLFSLRHNTHFDLFTHLSVTNYIILLLLFHSYYFAFSLRFYITMRLFGEKIPFLRIFAISQQALFYLFTLPSTAGYEAARFSKIFSHTKKISKKEAAHAVIVDRIAGVASSLIILVASTPFIHFYRSVELNKKVLFIGVAAILCLSLLLLNKKLYTYAADFIKTCLSNKLTLLRVISIACLAQFVLILIMTYAFQMITHNKISLFNIAFIQSISNMAFIIPISFAGLSGNEAGASIATLAFGYSLKVAILFSAIIYLCKLGGAIEGGIIECYESGVFIKNRRSKHKIKY